MMDFKAHRVILAEALLKEIVQFYKGDVISSRDGDSF